MYPIPWRTFIRENGNISMLHEGHACKGTPFLIFLFSISRIPGPDSINVDPWIPMDPMYGSALFETISHGNLYTWALHLNLFLHGPVQHTNLLHMDPWVRTLLLRTLN